jgi:hypothetical protein
MMSNKNTEQKNYHMFTIERYPKYDPAEVRFEVPADASLSEAIEVFERFLKAVGYTFPEGGSLDISYDDAEPVEDLTEEDLTLGDFKTDKDSSGTENTSILENR